MNKYPITSERLEIKPFIMDYCRELYELKQLPETHRYNYTDPVEEKEIRNHIRKLMEYDYTKPKDWMELAVIHRKENKLIGYTGFKGDGEFGPEKTAEIYYTIHPDYFNQGYGTEMVKAFLSFGFNVLKLHRIWAGATVENTGSWKIMEKTGMRRECLWVKDRPLPGNWIPGKGFEKTGEWEDGYGYAILKDEFKKL